MPALSFAQRELILKRSLYINCPNPEFALNRCDYALMIPVNINGKQQVSEYKYSIQPDNVTKTNDKEYFATWKKKSFSELNNGSLAVTMKVKIKVYDLKTAKKQAIKNAEDIDTLLYLKDEENFRIKAKNIKEAADKINVTGREEITKAIFNYVIDNLDYYRFFDQDRGAKRALKEGKGDCTEYSELMVTLCRAKKIPARIVEGLIPKSDGTIGYHNWVEVYFPQYDWVSFDPTWADHPKSTTTFYAMKNAYIKLSNKRYVTSVACPCYFNAEYPFSLRLKDTCVEITNDIGKKFKQMMVFYNGLQYVKADSLLDTLIIHEPDNYKYWLLKGLINARLGDHKKGIESLEAALKNTESNFEKYNVIYAFASVYAIKSDGETAVKYLKQAIDMGFDNYEHIYKDVDFVYIREYPPFVELQKELRSKTGNKEK